MPSGFSDDDNAGNHFAANPCTLLGFCAHSGELPMLQIWEAMKVTLVPVMRWGSRMPPSPRILTGLRAWQR